jgi:MFS family permease
VIEPAAPGTVEARAGGPAEPRAGGAATPPLDAHGLRDAVLITVVAALSVMAASAARPMVTYRAIGLGASPFEIGLVQSAYAALPGITAIGIGRWVDRAGEALITALGCLILAMGAVILAVAPSLYLLAVGQILMGFGIIVEAIATQSFVANRGPADRQVHRFGWFSVAVSSGQIAGPAMAAMLVPVAPEALAAGTRSGDNPEAVVFAVAALICLAAMLLVRALGTASRSAVAHGLTTDPNVARAALRVLRTPGIASAMFVSLGVASALDVLTIYLPAYGDANGLSVAIIGSLLAVRAAATLVARAFMGRLTDRLGPGGALLVTTATAAAAIGVLAISPPVPVLFALMILVGLGLGVGQPLTVAWIGMQSPRNERGLAFGVRHTGNLVTLTVVPAGMGLLAGATGLGAIWLVMAGFLAAGAIVAGRTRFAA